MDGRIGMDQLVDERPRDYAPPDYTELELMFDRSYYLATYADVRALYQGREHRVRDHWMAHGRDEVDAGTRHRAMEFDEAVYLRRRPDVAAAVQSGTLRSGYDHWLLTGRHEQEGAGQTALFDRHPAERPALLTPELEADWNRNGFMVLRGLFSPARCDAVTDRIDALWEDRASAPPVAADIHIDGPGAARVPFATAPAAARAMPYKINDLFLMEPAMQGLALDADLFSVLHWVLGSRPACAASLNFERGSTQGYHQDTLFMPGRTAGGMTAAWIALEDISAEAGPLSYYPGSHRIPLFHFSNKHPFFILEEMPEFNQYMMNEVAARKLEPATFLPRKGDVLIWHERLFHGGLPIVDPSRTRRSLVAHYWRADELPHGEAKSALGGYYWDREVMS